MNKSNQTVNHLGGADGFRAIACLAVIFHHLSQFLAMQSQSPWMQELQSFLLMGNAGVSVFFVLSGYLLASPYWHKYLDGSAYPDIKQYVVRRAARIMPGYYIAVMVATLITVLFHVPTEHFWARLMAGLTFTAGFHYITLFPNEVNGPLWSISFEVFCYVLMPMFMLGLYRWTFKQRSIRNGLLYWMGVFILILGLNQLVHLFFSTGNEGKGWDNGWIGGAKYWMPNYNPIGFFGQFTIGILAAGVAAGLRQSSEGLNRMKYIGLFDFVSLGGLFCSFALLWYVRHMPEFSLSLQKQPFFFPFYSLLIAVSLCAASQSRWAAKILDNRVFKFTSKVSFGLYLWHFVIIGVSSVTWAKDFQYMGTKSLSTWFSVSGVVLVVSFLFATLSFYFVEKPVLHWSHGKRKFMGNTHQPLLEA
ncbi:acyltransferase family protein [Paenibacillus aceris]|uniref:Peptidoglycan/LPS O-acetylase OafA/YrhL n=2 Tax=Paenibacillus aceris TaxID=869555 RepID=A0ABS4I3W5_9BACL|nr:peptidoglycan/LPS O-acetylase OafA/YrhL [Paenibacillus aceris]